MSNLKTASVLAFERNLDISDAFFWQSDSQSKDSVSTPVKVRDKSVRGTISNRLKNAIANDPAKLDAEIEKANLQTVDVAALDANKDILEICWTCKVLPFTGNPNVCNDPAYKAQLSKTVDDYLSNTGVGALASRYATNIANARWLWRNRLGAETIEIAVRCDIGNEKHEIIFNDAKQFSLNDFSISSEKLDELSTLVEQGLKGERFILLHIIAKAKVGYGQEVFPSQELILDTGKTKSKVLYVDNDENKQAGMHSQKVSNAIRTVDTWYSDDAKFPIAIEPYGAVTTLGTAFRQPKQKMDFYSLFDKWVLSGEAPAVEQQHYVMGVLIRGGVFGESGKE